MPHDMELPLGRKIRAMRSFILSYAILNLSLSFSTTGQVTGADKHILITTTYDPEY